MSALVQKAYDPHLLYHAINITVELEYKVPMQRVYDILATVEENNETNVEKIEPNDVLKLLKLLGDNLENTVLADEPSDENNLQAKIKELLRLLGCELSEQELNKILKGELSLDDALSKQAKAAWLIIFHKDKDGRFRPNREIVDHMLWCTQLIALENIEAHMQRAMIDDRAKSQQMQNEMILQKNDNLKTLYRIEQERYDPVVLERKRNQLRLYIAHMQGYDIDRDRDGGIGIDRTTGYVIDFGDIYIADKEHGSIIEDIERDGIDIGDIH